MAMTEKKPVSWVNLGIGAFMQTFEVYIIFLFYHTFIIFIL